MIKNGHYEVNIINWNFVVSITQKKKKRDCSYHLVEICKCYDWKKNEPFMFLLPF